MNSALVGWVKMAFPVGEMAGEEAKKKQEAERKEAEKKQEAVRKGAKKKREAAKKEGRHAQLDWEAVGKDEHEAQKMSLLRLQHRLGQQTASVAYSWTMVETARRV